MDYKRGTRIVLDEEKIIKEGKYDLNKLYQNIDELAEHAGLIKKINILIFVKVMSVI